MTKMHSAKNRAFWTMIIFLMIVASRMTIIHSLEFHQDEVWQVWSAMGTLQEVLAWVPFDWPPLFAIFSWAWTSLVGIHPYPVRIGALLISLLSYAFAFRFVIETFRHERMAWGATLIYAALGYSVFLSLFFRGYVLMTLLMTMALWAMGRYFRQPSLRWAIVLGLLMAGLFYTNLTAVTAFGAIGVLSLGLYTTRIWRWILPGSIATALALPEIIDKLALASRRTAASPLVLETTPLAAYSQLFSQFMGNAPLVWFIGVCLAVGIIIFYERIPKLPVMALTVWVFILPVVIYLLDDVLGFFTLRHSWWILLGIALLLSYALQYLPKRLVDIGLVGVIVIMFLPLPLDEYANFDERFEETFRQLQAHYRAGDVVLVDPFCNCGDPMHWNYYERAYFPDSGLAFITEPDDYQRIWYVSFAGQADETLLQSVLENRYASTFFGRPGFLFQLYEGAPNPEGVRYENGLVFHGAQILGTVDSFVPVAHEGETVRVRLWWQTTDPLPADYSVSLQLASPDGIIAQDDSAPPLVMLHPLDTSQPSSQTSQWEVNTMYVAERMLEIPNPTEAGIYQLNLIVYQSWDGVRISSDETNADGIYEIMPFAVMSW